MNNMNSTNALKIQKIKSRGPKSKQEEQNPKWVTNGQKNKLFLKKYTDKQKAYLKKQ